jgi:predicted aminopeptidase
MAAEIWRTPRVCRALARAALVCALSVSIAGCAFYWQAIGGQLDLMRKRTPIEELLSDPGLDPKLKSELGAVGKIRKFAVTDLLLPDNKSYTTYVALDRPYVVWNVVAAEEFSVEPKRWCFPFAGCVSYRGFFDRADAERFEKKLASEGYDTSSGGSDAYSTLGYFADPVLSTMIGSGVQNVASLLFHELAHQKLYVKNDSEFSEAFATAIEEYGTERWLSAHADEAALAAYRRRLRHRSDFAALVSAQQERLRAVFATSEPKEQKRADKARAFDAMRADYAAVKQSWGGGAGDYDAWFARPLNNAALAAVATYRRWVPVLRARIDVLGLQAFYAEMAELAKLKVPERAERLESWRAAASASAGIPPQTG